MNDQKPGQHPIILFDGVCNLCNSSVQFIITRDPGSTFRFTSLQSDSGIELLKKFNLSPERLYSIIFVQNDRYFDKSRAALEIAKRMNGLWPGLYVLIIVPPFIRDFIYNWISRNRYKWFGRQNECMIPTPELKSRFL